MKAMLRYINIFFFIFLAMSSLLFAGNTGKIIGKVTDSKGEPLVGANVLVVGTTRGAVTDPDGEYSIIGVPIGTYAVRASQIGFQSMEVTGVKVGADETTRLNFKLEDTALEQDEVVIRADQVLVNPLSTGSTKQISDKKIEQIPNVKDVSGILSLQAGVVKQGKNLFLRGGRANEVQYVVDGVPVNSIVGNTGELTGTTKANEDIARVAAGVSSGTVGGGSGALSVSANAIQSISVQTSGFDADFGNAQSGIVNITTKSGGDKIVGGLQFRTDKIANTNQNEVYQSFNLGGPEPISKYLLPSLGIKVPGSLSFFFSGDITRSDGPYTYVENEFFHPQGRRIELKGFLGGVLDGLGVKFYDNLSNSFTFNSKLKYDISGNDQVSYGYRASLSTAHGYSHAWRYRADSSTLSSTLSTQHVLSWTHFFSPKAFMKVNLAKLEHHDGNDLSGLKPSDYPEADPESPGIDDFDPTNDGFYDIGSSQRWYQSNTEQWSLRFDYNGQIHPLHMLKTGFEFNYEVLQSTDISRPTARIRDDSTGELISPPYPDYMDRNRGLYPGYGNIRYVLDNYPLRGAFYVQDNIEYSGLNIHIGIRYDYFDLGKQIFYKDFVDRWFSNVNQGEENADEKLYPKWVEAQGKDENGAIKSEEFLSDSKRFLYYLTHGNFSPRLAIGYPVTDRIVFYFNYGHFYQYPERDRYYRDLPRETESWMGNPDLRPQKSVTYEAGFEDQVTDETAFSVHAFYKDIFDYVKLIKRLGEVRIYENLDYASTRGFEIAVNQSFSSNLAANVSYSYQLAKGRSSSDIGTITNPNSDLPRETRLDWDQTHTANLFFSYRVGHNEEGDIFGLPFNNYGVSLTWSFGSGFPYTPQIVGDATDIKNEYLQNNETRPYTSTLNLSFYKGFLLFGSLNTTVTLDVTNVLNRRNVATGDPNAGFNHREGRPFVFGDYNNINERVIYSYNGMESRIPPYIFEAPRQFLLGVKLNWE